MKLHPISNSKSKKKPKRQSKKKPGRPRFGSEGRAALCEHADKTISEAQQKFLITRYPRIKRVDSQLKFLNEFNRINREANPKSPILTLVGIKTLVDYWRPGLNKGEK